jgi:Na+-driven multidrug efflux pump
MWIVMILALSMSGASGINMAQRLGKMDYLGAKQAGYVGVVMAGGVTFLISLAVLCNMRHFGQIFTNDEIFLTLFEETKWSFTTTLFLMNFSVVLERIPYSMGRTKEVFWMGFIASWGGMYACTMWWRVPLLLAAVVCCCLCGVTMWCVDCVFSFVLFEDCVETCRVGETTKGILIHCSLCSLLSLVPFLFRIVL